MSALRGVRTGRAWIAAALLVPVLAVVACAPVVMSAGLPRVEAALAKDALVMADGARLPLRAWLPEGEPPRAVLLGLHGFGDHSGNAFDTPAPLLNARGVALYAYDQRGFGAAPHRGYWAGAPTLVSDAVAAARLVRARHPGVPLYMMGESMGVAVLLVAAASPQPLPADGYVLLAPAVRGRASMGAFAAKAMDVLSWVMPAVAFYGSSPGFAPTDNEAAMERWSRDPLTLKQFRVD
ncbi:MAG: Lysophospholipase, partial [uncultured Acetobacteraceae bacterium]